MLESIADVATLLIVNDNAPDPSPHGEILSASRFAQEDRIVVDRTPFTGFAAARNVCLRLHGERNAGEWVAFIDADEVHGERVRRIAERLDRVPPKFDFVDGYTWHFFASFDYYTSIERRMMFFRYRPDLRWEGAVHEQLRGLTGRRLAVPYVYAHYGHTLEPRRHAEKGRQYSSLGAPGNVLREERAGELRRDALFRAGLPAAAALLGYTSRCRASHARTIASGLAGTSRLTRAIVGSQSAGLKLRNVARRINYEWRWRARVLDPLARASRDDRGERTRPPGCQCPNVLLPGREGDAVYRPVKRKARKEIRRDPHLSTGMAAAFRHYLCKYDRKLVYLLTRGGSLLTAPKES